MALTTGAVTGVIDRLDKGGLVGRVKDPADRRRVVVRITDDPEHLERQAAMFRSLGEASARLLERFTDDQLKTILEFVTLGTQMMRGQTAKLREGTTAKAQS